MPVRVLKHIRGSQFPAEWLGEDRLEPDETFKVFVVSEREIQEPPPRKEYSDEVKMIVAEGKRLAEEDKKAGKTREESFAELFELQEEIEKYL